MNFKCFYIERFLLYKEVYHGDIFKHYFKDGHSYCYILHVTTYTNYKYNKYYIRDCVVDQKYYDSKEFMEYYYDNTRLLFFKSLIRNDFKLIDKCNFTKREGVI